jgi:uncharacterized protein YjbI with pentapeptide repeats
MFYETWYKSLLLTRAVRTEPGIEQHRVQRLRVLGSNCINLLGAPPRCDLTNRDFSGCEMPYAYFYKRDLSGSKIAINGGL